MSIERKTVDRRTLLRGALAAAAVIPLSGALAACAGGSSDSDDNKAKGGKKSEDNPFGMAADSTTDAVIFDGGYGTDYVAFAATLMQKNHKGSTVKVSPTTEISQELQPRFVAGDPPDLIDNSGENSIGFSTILDQVEDLTDVLDANNLEGTKIRDTLYDGVEAPGTFDGKLAALNYVLTVYAVWYSSSLFEENGWTPPKTWDEAIALGAEAKKKDKYLFLWGKEAATYYQTLAIGSAIKQGGDEVRLALENLEANCWSNPSVQAVFKAMGKIVDAGYIKPGGAGTQFTAAQAQWSNNQDALLYPSGSWIENEMKDQTKAGFEMKGFPEMVVNTDSAMPWEALHSAAGEPFQIPSQGKNVPGGKELLRTMLSKEAATNFAKTKLAPTIVKDTVPADGFGSTALVSQSEMLSAAGSNVFTWTFVDLYGTNVDQLVVWNSFLAGKSSVKDLTSRLQQITDKIREDDSIKKIPVT
ncbi:N-acetylglucosamine/diacetylchitobiose ABC transporter substrate-binding protein [Mumia zhuanghuii]|uniref:Carbohydrate ABC transporter, N-acetylglucosamine/diacetylchitobiose-binding protein n=1 Tax=Mumia zhuanghuii TaxID=2585211 RepID=A0A5C4MEH6_9ACTN|nr:N-acetylglucosamine/diacetylchitobiose ABC transporter substrate-binding protein [Mumia zhuanghuii]TNC33116.1 carbohydrate ABC transporter, N-acetylglucosamine/diacetylchitobiose-binding protein [Mumia zhuanghuii]TNC44254.1 carbohydrate ABC transporter, N-acetylglucosamine/diacetylchitobiose-binding protein [Mumia zhuanghuii]